MQGSKISEPGKGKPQIIYNTDNIPVWVVPAPYTEEKVSLTVDYLTDSQVDVLCWSMYGGFIAYWPSKVIENWPEKYQGEPNELASDAWHKQIDYLPTLIRETQQRGIKFFPSFRMNDSHHRSTPEDAVAFWKAHQEYRLWEVTAGETYYNATLDYSCPEVRQHVFDAIYEYVHLYDVDGVELDFFRNPYIFQPSEAWAKRQILTDFIKQIKLALTAIGEKKHKRIDLLIRVPFAEDRYTQPGENRLVLAGMDVEVWIKNQYMDILVMSYGENNFDQAVEPWRSLCRAHNILFYPAIEARSAVHHMSTPVRCDNLPLPNIAVKETTNETIMRQRAAAQNFLAQGVDGVYMFNYPCLLYEEVWTKAEFERLTGVVSEMGDLETLKGKAKQYVFWRNLPITAESGRPPRYHQTLTFHVLDFDMDDDNTQVTLTFRQAAEKNPHAEGDYVQDPFVAPGWVTYILNGKKIADEWIRRTRQPAGKISSGFAVTEHELIEITVTAEMMVCGENTLAFHIDRFPASRDPYVRFFELLVDVIPATP